MLVRAACAHVGLVLLLLLSLAGCAEDTREPECVAALENADRCGLDTSNWTCPDVGEADAFESCGYPCFSNVEDCSEFSNPESPWGVCFSDCTARYSAPLPEQTSGDVD